MAKRLVGIPGLLIFAALWLGGCAAPRLYSWGNYEESLYTHYKNPQDRASYTATLKKVVEDAEQQGGKIPPGLYAEYGYALFEEGKPKEAAAYFEKEKKQWPESGVFMDKMIMNALRRQGTTVSSPPVQPAAGPAKSDGGGGK